MYVIWWDGERLNPLLPLRCVFHLSDQNHRAQLSRHEPRAECVGYVSPNIVSVPGGKKNEIGSFRGEWHLKAHVCAPENVFRTPAASWDDASSVSRSVKWKFIFLFCCRSSLVKSVEFWRVNAHAETPCWRRHPWIKSPVWWIRAAIPTLPPVFVVHVHHLPHKLKLIFIIPSKSPSPFDCPLNSYCVFENKK